MPLSAVGKALSLCSLETAKSRSRKRFGGSAAGMPGVEEASDQSCDAGLLHTRHCEGHAYR